ncbi:tumor necrosis factor receptor superfamily member 11A-like isoform X2 [Carcharodon carcharias]|uniref:tumor necrosis factor receptor superfamily member 11A-like isoform X2 n=1 Tax=Carcharodon carcharias TaxID=13397 RepID=UPI001B7EABAD|nr:tumor necrosis factor receptor superfamily member 11A-like isoform X2 [Carcharodon carcharias]
MELVRALLALCAYGACSVALSRDCPAQYIKNTGRVECCSKCPPGKFMEAQCTETSDSICQPCPDRSYSKDWNFEYFCFRCDECSHGMTYKQNCTATSNVQCECIEGYVCKDEHCNRCAPKDKGSENNPYSPRTYTDPIKKTSPPWMNCTTLGHLDITHASQTSDTISAKTTDIQMVETVMIIVGLICLALLCLLLGIQMNSWRKNRRKTILLPADMSPWYLNMQVDDTYSIHFPEQECGGLSHQEGKSIEQIVLADHCIM